MPYQCRPLDKRFWAKVQKQDMESCWLWQGATTHQGYGVIYSHVDERGKYINLGAHQVSWFLHFGQIPVGLDVLHTCDNPPCVNPAHLWVGTASDNAQDMLRKGRNHPRRGSAHYGAKLNEDTVRIIRILRTRKWPLQALAEFFNVSYGTVRGTVARESWKHV